MTRAGKINMLYPMEREVYKLRRVGDATLANATLCKRCGNPVIAYGVNYSVRDRGSRCLNVEVGAIHTRCVPEGDAPIGIKARGRNVSQVRAGKG